MHRKIKAGMSKPKALTKIILECKECSVEFETTMGGWDRCPACGAYGSLKQIGTVRPYQ